MIALRELARTAGRNAVVLVVAMLITTPCRAAELPPEIQIDRLLVQAERETRDGNHWSAVYTLERVLRLHEEHGLEVPSGSWFHQATVFQDAEMHERAIQASTRYLRDAGREGDRATPANTEVTPPSAPASKRNQSGTTP